MTNAEVQARYWANQAASLTEAQQKWLLASRTRKLASGRKLTNAEIGAKIGKSGHWVSSVARVLNSKRRIGLPRAKANLSEQDIALFIEMWGGDLSNTEIGEHFGYSRQWATRLAQKLELPRRISPVTMRQVAEIRRLVAAGDPFGVVATKVGVSISTVHSYATPIRRQGAPPSRINAGMADRLYRSGMKQGQIAALYGVCRQSVSYAIKKYRKQLEARSLQKPKYLIPPVRIAA